MKFDFPVRRLQDPRGRVIQDLMINNPYGWEVHDKGYHYRKTGTLIAMERFSGALVAGSIVFNPLIRLDDEDAIFLLATVSKYLTHLPDPFEFYTYHRKRRETKIPVPDNRRERQRIRPSNIDSSGYDFV